VERKQSGARLGEAYLFVCAREGGMGWGVGATVRMELTRGWRWGDGLMAAASRRGEEASGALWAVPVRRSPRACVCRVARDEASQLTAAHGRGNHLCSARFVELVNISFLNRKLESQKLESCGFILRRGALGITNRQRKRDPKKRKKTK
jgi:hypothetical protein